MLNNILYRKHYTVKICVYYKVKVITPCRHDGKKKKRKKGRTNPEAQESILFYCFFFISIRVNFNNLLIEH